MECKAYLCCVVRHSFHIWHGFSYISFKTIGFPIVNQRKIVYFTIFRNFHFHPKDRTPLHSIEIVERLAINDHTCQYDIETYKNHINGALRQSYDGVQGLSMPRAEAQFSVFAWICSCLPSKPLDFP